MRASGILMPISSLPSPYGIGTMGAAARSFVDFLVKSGQAYWQILPVCPTSYGDSPYQSFSTFAGNPYFIDLDDLAKQGLLLPEEYASIDWECTADCINYGVMYEKRYAVLRCAAKRLLAKPGADYRRFVKENDFWLPDYALFMALKDAHNGVCWLEWEEPLRRREPAALAAARQQYADDVAFWQAVQFMFYSQWQALKHYANQQEIRIIGDLPIYVPAGVPARREPAAHRGGRLPAGRLLRHRPAVGQPAVRLGLHGQDRLRMVGAAHQTHVQYL